MASWRLISKQLLIAVLAMLAPPLPAGAVPAVSFEFGRDGCGPSNVEGWEFQTLEPLTVSALGAYDYVLDGLDRAIPVGLFDASCTLIASATVPGGQVAPLQAQFRYVPIAPLVLPAGQTFRIAAVVGCDDFSPDFPTLDGVVLHPGLTAVTGKRLGFGTMLACPTETGSGVDFAANFIIAPPCGNGILQEGEQCDDGNGDDADCCSNACTPQHAGAPCAPDGVCTIDRCTAAGVCEHVPGNAGTVCRAPEFDCDAAETCDGESAQCPEGEDYAPDGTPCTDDGLYCDGEEVCGQGECNGAGNPCEELAATCDEDTDQCVPWTPTVTVVPTASATPVATATRSVTPTSPPTATVPASPTRTAAPTATDTVPSSPTRSPSRTSVPTATIGVATSTFTGSPIRTPVPSETTGPPTATVTGSPMRTPVPSETATTLPTASATCRGDCDLDGSVTINELITAVTIALGSQPLSLCPSLDSSTNAAVEINELITAVASALAGCA